MVLRKNRTSHLENVKARYLKLVNKNNENTLKCRNKHCITPKIKKYCQAYWKRTRKNYRKLKTDKYDDCFMSNVMDMKAKGLYDSMPECTKKHKCYKISKTVLDEMLRLEREM